MMETRQLNIEGRQNPNYVVASLNDFGYTDGGRIVPDVVLENPDISLYCLDDSGKRAIFVELPAGIDLTKAPFVYRTQYEHAQRLIAVPYEIFTQLASTLPEVHRPIFIYMSGRSGSTLLSHVFNESNVVVSLAEPDVVTQFSHLLEGTGGNRDSELRNLAQSTMRFLFRQYHTEGIQAFAVKLRAQGVRVMNLFQSAFLGAKNLFLYRDAVGWATSFYRIWRNLGVPEYSPVSVWRSQMEPSFNTNLSKFTTYLDEGREDISLPEQFALWWIATMEWYLEQVECGCPVLPVRYDDLIQYREQTLRAIFAYCELPLSNVKQGMRAFDRDAQAGTVLARENPKESNKRMLSDEQVQSVKAILGRHPVLKTPYFTVPGTLQIYLDSTEGNSVPLES